MNNFSRTQCLLPNQAKTVFFLRFQCLRSRTHFSRLLLKAQYMGPFFNRLGRFFLRVALSQLRKPLKVPLYFLLLPVYFHQPLLHLIKLSSPRIILKLYYLLYYFSPIFSIEPNSAYPTPYLYSKRKF